MNKVMYLLLCFSFFNGVLVFSNGLPKQIVQSTGDGNWTLDGSCVYYETFHIILTNLDVLNGNTSCIIDPSNSYCAEPLPNGYPAMIFRFELNGQIDTIRPDSFFLVAVATDTTPSLYGFTHYINMPISSYCTLKDDPNPIPIFVSSEILMERPGGLIPYSICDYVAPGDIFACDFFDETAPYCGYGPDLPDCNNADLATYTYSGEITCQFCELVEAEGGPLDSIPRGGDGRYGEQVEEELLLEETIVVVSPNPFNEKIEIQWKGKPSLLHFKLYDINGRLVKSVKNFQLEEKISWGLDTSDLPGGMYILQVESEQESQFVKLVKP